MNTEIRISQAEIGEFCHKHHIRKLSLFGSVLRADFGSDSDLDVLVEFEPGHVPGFITMAGMEIELSQLLGHTVDLRTAAELSPYFRQDVLEAAELQYEAR
jgi:predicted nucleotidyltransferase